MKPSTEKMVRSAALLRNRIESCLRAASAPMVKSEIMEYSGVKEVIMNLLNADEKVSIQLRSLTKLKIIDRIGYGRWSSYAIVQSKGRIIPPSPKITDPIALEALKCIRDPLQDLHLRINKAAKTIEFTFNGLTITIEIKG